MTTSDRARELAEEWKCDAGHCAGIQLIHPFDIEPKIAALLDLLVEAKDYIKEIPVPGPATRSLRNVLIEKIDRVLGEGK